jgi:uncharacterized delta-60 repeat protein
VAASLVLALVVAVTAGSAFGRGASGSGRGWRVATRFEVHPQGGGRIADLATGPGGDLALATQGFYAQPISVAVLTADGSPDLGFSGDGLIQPQLEPGHPFADDPVRVLLTGEGSDLSLTVAATVDLPSGKTEVEIRRYGADGRLDPSFGRRGVVDTPGKEVAGLFPGPGGGLVLFAEDPGYYTSEVVRRFGPDGTPIRSSKKSKGLPQIRAVFSRPGGGFILEVGAERSNYPSLIRLDRIGRPIGKPVSKKDGWGFELLAADADGRALGILGGKLVRLDPDNRTVDSDFRPSIPACASGSTAAYPRAVLPELDGRILVSVDCGLVRLESDGSLDPTFGGGVPVSGVGGSSHLALRAGGSIVFATWRGKGALPTVGRLDGSGATDTSFGSTGTATLSLPAPRSSRAAGIIATGDKLIAAGTALCATECERFALARYGARSGRLDRSFGKGGTVTGTPNLGAASGLATTPGGDIVVVGSTPEPGRVDRGKSFALEEFHPSGSPNLSFGKNGSTFVQVSNTDNERSEATAVAVGSAGKIVVVGTAGCPEYEICFTVARFLPSGRLDRSFGHGGVFRMPSGIEATAVAIDGRNRVVATGGEEGYFITVRLTGRGRLDKSFGAGGIVIHRQRNSFKELYAGDLGPKALAIEGDGSIVVAGGNQTSHAIFERYLPSGRRDPKFGHRGRLLVQPLGVTALATTRCGIVAAGTMHPEGREEQMAIAGLAHDGHVHFAPRPIFGDALRSNGAAVTLAGGRAIVAGGLRRYARSSEFALAATPLDALVPDC